MLDARQLLILFRKQIEQNMVDLINFLSREAGFHTRLDGDANEMLATEPVFIPGQPVAPIACIHAPQPGPCES